MLKQTQCIVVNTVPEQQSGRLWVHQYHRLLSIGLLGKWYHIRIPAQANNLRSSRGPLHAAFHHPTISLKRLKYCLTLLHSERSKICGVLAVLNIVLIMLSAVGLTLLHSERTVEAIMTFVGAKGLKGEKNSIVSIEREVKSISSISPSCYCIRFYDGIVILFQMLV